jgi:uncharacterized membrane protein
LSPFSALPPRPALFKRVEFIDLLRGGAVIVMIETHVFNATLSSELFDGTLFNYIKFLNGLVAPSFLFASGLAYAVTTRRKLNEYLSFGKPLSKQLGRLLFILALGYLLHIPKFNYAQLLSVQDDHALRAFFQADVLQCIAVSLLFMQVLLLVVRSERRMYRILLVVTGGIVLLTPVMWGIDFWPVLPAILAGYMNGMHFQDFPGFPVFPWSSFLFAGALAGHYYEGARSREGRDIAMMKRACWWVLAFIVGSIIFHPLAGQLYPTYDYWKFSPSFVLLRLALVMLLCAGLFFYEKWKGVSPRSVVTLIGRESLIVYVAHLLLIYGNFASFNFAKRVGHSFGYVEAILTTLILFSLMYGLAHVWGRVKRESPRWKMALQYGVLAVLVAVFFFGPGE